MDKDWIFEPDKDPKHRAAVVTNWLNREHIECLKCRGRTPAGRTRPVKSRSRQSKRQYMTNLRQETGRILPVWYRQYYARIMQCSIRSDTTVVNGETRNVLRPYFNVIRSHFNVYNRK